MNDCVRCHRALTDNARLCHPCTDTLTRDLGDITHLWPQLQVTVTRRDRIGAPGRSGAETPLPYSVSASMVQDQAQNTLTTWARHASAELGTPIDDTGTAAVASARYLRSNTRWVRTRDEAAQIVDDIHRALRDIIRAIDRPPGTEYLGACDQCHRGLYAPPGRPRHKCPCGATYDTSQRRDALLEQADNELATATTIARALTSLGDPVTPGRIWQWAARGRLQVHGSDDKGRPLYHVREVRALLIAPRKRVRD